MKPLLTCVVFALLVHELDTIIVLLASVINLVVTFIALFLHNIHYFYVNYVYINKLMLGTCLFSPWGGGGGHFD